MNTIKLSFKAEVKISKFFKTIINGGWSFDDEGKVRYLPMNDNSNFNWQSLPVSEWDNVYEIMKEKEDIGELIGITLIYEEANAGGIFHIENNKVIFFPTINRKVINQNLEITDFSWYIEKIVSTFEKSHWEILEIEASQILA